MGECIGKSSSGSKSTKRSGKKPFLYQPQLGAYSHKLILAKNLYKKKGITMKLILNKLSNRS